MSNECDFKLECKPVLVTKGSNYVLYGCIKSQTGQHLWNYNGCGWNKDIDEMEYSIAKGCLKFWEFDTLEDARNFINIMIELERK